MGKIFDIDSKDIPSLGYPTGGSKKNNDKAKISSSDMSAKRELAIWIYQLILRTIKTNPDIEELKKICARQDIVIKKQNDAIKQSNKITNELKDLVVLLERRIKELDSKTNEYKNWEDQMRRHISSVDEKAGSIEQLRSLIYALWDVTVQTVEPDVEKAEFLVKSFRHLINMGPEKRTRNSKIIDRKRWIDEKV